MSMCCELINIFRIMVCSTDVSNPGIFYVLITAAALSNIRFQILQFQNISILIGYVFNRSSV